tara:strand:- start:3851 stop:6202 length:2352 start_codon:yes stop_codon:yes gene_type:complete
MKRNSFLSSLIFIIFISNCFGFATSVNGDEQYFTLSGNVYISDGVYAGDTSIKFESRDSVWTKDTGRYEITDIPYGEHVVRAYFKDNGHTVSYRKIFFDSDLEFDWYEGKNWVTLEMFDENNTHVKNSQMSTIELIQTGDSSNPINGRLDFGPLNIGDYYTVRAYYGDSDQSTQFIHFKVDSSTPNDFDFNHGKNSRYGFIKFDDGTSISGVTISNGATETLSNEDGFFLFEDLEVGSSQTFTFKKANRTVANPINVTIESGQGWMNVSALGEVNYPDSPKFVTQTQVLRLSMLPMSIQWSGGNHTLFYTLTVNKEKIYEGFDDEFLFDTEETGNFEFQIGATNSNGTTNNTQKLLLMVMPEQSSDDLWQPGMSWDYDISYTPKSVSPDSEGIHHAKFTVLGKEKVIDSYGNEKDTFLMRKTDEYHMEREKSYHWVDSNNLFTLRTYWEDDPSSSSYYQEGTLGWNFTDLEGNEVNPLLVEGNFSMDFNRTNIIGVPGHPNGYDDTKNIVVIKPNVIVNTPAGSFSTTHISIIDNDDKIVSWDLWYNETVRNWVKKIDRLPGSHAEIVEYNLTGYSMPLTPQFITEDEGNYIVNDYDIEWAPFIGAEYYKLLENDKVIYSGNETSFYLEDRLDGDYRYEIYAILPSEAMIKSEAIKIQISFIPNTPEFITDSQEISKGESLLLLWKYDEDIFWYSVIVENQEGVKVEVYNGTDNSTTLENLDSGQNRIRVKAQLTNGKISALSDSIFIKVEESTEDSPMLSFFSTLIALILVTLNYKSGNKKK